MIYKIVASFLVLLLSGCSVPKPMVLSLPKDKLYSSYSAKDGYFYVLLQKQQGIYKVVDITETPIDKISNASQEVLRVSNDYKIIEPYFKNALPYSEQNRYDCTASLNSNVYNQCTTDFSSSYKGASVAKNIVSVISASSTSGSHRYIDYEAIAKAVKESNLVEKLEEKRLLLEMELAFSSLRTKEDFDVFISKYAFTGSPLLQEAIKKRDSLNKQEAPNDLSMYDSDEILRKKESQIESNKKATLLALRSEQNSINSINQKLQSFRKSIAVGSKTNCGEVVELRASEARIKRGNSYVVIQKDKLFPKEYECIIAKGRYIPPPSF